ncbi:phage portal protein [Escherichia albertii]|nr:phage portal protein [Escherichia albertii]
MKRTPVLIDVNGVPLRESLSYNGGGAGFGGQMAEWLPPAQSVDAALLPALRLGNARADDLVRNNGIAANAVALHKDHIVGHMFLISYRPNWRWLGMRETAAKSFVDEVEAAWSEYAEGMFGEIDVEGKRTFTEFIREGVGVHAFIGLSMEDTEEGKLSQFLVAANRIAFIDPSNGNTRPMFVGQGDQIFMNDVFLKRLTAPTITSGGNPPAFSLTPDGRLTAKNADISGNVNANSGTLNNVTISENCTIKGMLEATQVRGDFVKAVSKAFPKKVGTWGNTETPDGTVTVTISDDHNFDRQIIIPPIIFNGIAYTDPGSGNNPGGTRYTGYGFEVRKNGVLIASRETKGAIPGSYSAVIDMPGGRGSVTLEFKIYQKGNQGAGNITDCTVIVTKKAASGISIR